MTPVQIGNATLHLGDCLDVLKTLPENSIDAIVTDPPYGLSFMGQKWDYDVPSVEIWTECLRVLKPGGHLLAFAGTRTQHRMAVRIEDAGFEIRDMIAWVYGSGFPKSLDVSKAIDKMDASQEQLARRYRFTNWIRSCGVSSRQIDEATGTNMGGHYTTQASQPAIMTREHLEACRHLFPDIPAWVEQEADIRSVESKNFAEREVVGLQKNAMSGWNMDGTTKFADRNITTPATEAAKQWEGWGTALKPSLEPVTVARKPLIGTVADNVLEHGTGGLNIDGCRVVMHPGDTKGEFGPRSVGLGENNTNGIYGGGFARQDADESKGRWPANLIHDGSEEVLAGFPFTTSGAKNPWVNTSKTKNNSTSIGQGIEGKLRDYTASASSGSAARFFYTAKASKDDRDEKNTHPTVKPTDLMRHLVRMVTPPGGVVLDCFMGSGSTGKAAALEGFSFIGIERESEFFEIASRRIHQSSAQGQLFEPEPIQEVRALC
jgi:DNA modification methylase